MALRSVSSQQFVTGKNVYCTSFRANKFIFYIQSKCVDMQGPVPAGEKHDRTMFCGGTKEEGRANWDRSAVYFKLNEGQKLMLILPTMEFLRRSLFHGKGRADL